jgi:hypothetical protein
MPSNPLESLPIVEYIRLIGVGTLLGLVAGVTVTMSVIVYRLRHLHETRVD